MRKLKRIFCVMVAIVIAVASCKNISVTDAPPAETGFKQPVSEPLKFSASKKIDWAAIKATPVKPVVKKFDLNKLPVKPYDISGFKPFKYPVVETKFNIDSLPGQDLDIDKIPSKPLKFKTYKLPLPKLIKTTPPRLKDTSMSLFEFGEAQGFGSSDVNILFRDRDGFMWIDNDEGLYRYDGESLLLYLPMHSANYIRQMAQDQLGRLWITVANEGIEVLDPAAGTISKTNMDLGLNSSNPNGILVDKQQNIWVTTYHPGGIYIIDPKAQTVKWLDKANGLSSLDISRDIILDKHNNVWISSDNGPNVIDLKNKKIKYFNNTQGLGENVGQLFLDNKGKILMGFDGGAVAILDVQKGTLQLIKEVQFQGPAKDALMYNMIQDDKGRIWFGTSKNGVAAIDPEKRTALKLRMSSGLSGNLIMDIKQDSQGQIWVATSTGLNIIGNRGAIIGHIGKTPTTTLAEDRQGLVWQGSFNSGVNIIDRKAETMRHFNKSQGLANDTLNFIREINGQILIGTNNGLDVIDSAKQTITYIGKEQGLDTKAAYLATIDKEYRIWIVAANKGIDIYDPRNSTIKYLGKLQGLSDTTITDISPDQRGNIWISTTTGGMDEIDPLKWTIRYLNNASLKSVTQRPLQPDNAGNMWIGTRTGVYIADMKNQKLISLSTPQGLIDEAVISLLKHGNQVYAGTTKGISVITHPAGVIGEGENWQVESFGKSYGLNKVTDAVETDLVTKDGTYWWGDAGLTLLDLTKKDRFIPDIHITGINIMDLARHFTGRQPSVSNNMNWETVTGPNNLPVNLQLRYDQNYLQFKFGNLDLTSHDTVWYKYRLIGSDKNWSNDTVANQSKNYFNLRAGKYTFEVTSKSGDNGWSKPAVLSFTVNPPWWQTWWAYVLYAVLLGGTIWGFSHYRSLQLIKDKRLLEHKVHVRTEEVLHQKEEIEAQRDDLDKAFRELKTTQTQLIQAEKMASLGELTAGIAHEIQNPLNFVNNFSEVSAELVDEMDDELDKGGIEEAKAIGADLKHNLEKIRHHGKRADAIVKGMLQHSQSGSGAKEPTNINSLADEYLRLSYHGLRSKDKRFSAEMVTHFDEKLPLINVIPQDIGRVMLNLFNNAFYAVNQKAKTAGENYKPEVSVSTAPQPPLASGGAEAILIIVKDNGVGIPDAIKEKIMQPFFTTKPTGEGTGLGLSLTYDMVVKGHGGSISVNTKEGEYTEFIVSLPLN